VHRTVRLSARCLVSVAKLTSGGKERLLTRAARKTPR